MKSIKRIIFAAVAICAVFAFAACKEEDDGTSVSAVYENATEKQTVTFYDDSTFTVAQMGKTVYTGTYTGDAAKDGEITITPKKMPGTSGSLEDIPSAGQTPILLKITNGKVTFMNTEYTRK